MNTQKQQYIQKFTDTFATLKRVMGRMCSISSAERLTTTLQYQALSYLVENQNTTVGELAHALAMSSSAIAQLIERLLKAGRVVRTSDPDDRRIFHINVTEGGKKELAEMKRRYIEKMSFFLSHISDKDLQELIRIQTELIKKLEDKKPTT